MKLKHCLFATILITNVGSRFDLQALLADAEALGIRLRGDKDSPLAEIHGEVRYLISAGKLEITLYDSNGTGARNPIVALSERTAKLSQLSGSTGTYIGRAPEIVR